MKKFLCLLLVMALFASCKNDGGSSNPAEDPSTPAEDPSAPDSLEFNVDGVSFKMIKVEGGTFQMGEEGVATPVHSVTLSDYYIGETEVTCALWQAVMDTCPCEAYGDDLPVNEVSWYNCQEFIGKLNQKTGRRFALPTEAQWEFAARGGNKSRGYEYSGGNNIDDVAWYWFNVSSMTQPVGTKLANELGLYDMSGNVCEWCADWYDDYSSSSQTDPTGPKTGSSRVNRGGGWLNLDDSCRSASRDYDAPDSHFFDLGLRLVLLF